MRLNLGCSDDLRGGEWVNVDIAPVSCPMDVKVEIVDLALPWPWEDSSVDEIKAADIFEHIGDDPSCRDRVIGWSHAGEDDEYIDVFIGARHWSGRIHVMNESWRVLKPGGILTMECPDAAKGAGHFQDPTHVTPWTPNGLQYFVDGSGAWKRFHEAYGITARFKVLKVSERKYEEMAGAVRCEVWKFTAILETVK